MWKWESDPFGTGQADEDPDGDGTKLTFNLRFPGQYYDEETGLHYNYFRDYDPSTGRYTTSDPIGLRGGPNTYTYARGNPLYWIDLFGLEITGKFKEGPTITNHLFAESSYAYSDNVERVFLYLPVATISYVVECTETLPCGKERRWEESWDNLIGVRDVMVIFNRRFPDESSPSDFMLGGSMTERMKRKLIDIFNKNVLLHTLDPTLICEVGPYAPYVTLPEMPNISNY